MFVKNSQNTHDMSKFEDPRYIAFVEQRTAQNRDKTWDNVSRALKTSESVAATAGSEENAGVIVGDYGGGSEGDGGRPASEENPDRAKGVDMNLEREK